MWVKSLKHRSGKLWVAAILLGLAPMAEAASTAIISYGKISRDTYRVTITNIRWDASDRAENPCYQSSQCLLDISAFISSRAIWPGPPLPSGDADGTWGRSYLDNKMVDISGSCSASAVTMGALKPCVQQYLGDFTYNAIMGDRIAVWVCPSVAIRTNAGKKLDAMRGGLSCISGLGQNPVQCTFLAPATLNYGNISLADLGGSPVEKEGSIGIECSGKTSVTVRMLGEGNVQLANEYGVLYAKLFVQGQEISSGPKRFEVPSQQSSLKLKSQLVAANPKLIQAKSYSGSTVISIEVN